MTVLGGWRERRVRDVCELGRGRVISSQEIERHPGVYPVFSSQSSNNGQMGAIDTFDFDGEYVTWTTDGAYAGTVFCRSGKFNCTNVCGTLRARDDQINMPFLAYKLSTVAKDYVSYVGNPKLMNGVVADIRLTLPQFRTEQAKIAEILSTVDRAIEQTEALIAKQQRIKTGLMQDLLTRGIDEHGNLRSEDTHEFKDSALGRIPVEWEVCDLRSYAQLQGGFAFSSKHSRESGVRWLKIANVGVNALRWETEDFLPNRHLLTFNDYALGDGDIVVALTRPVIRGELKIAQVSQVDVPCLLNQRVARVILGEGADLEFLLSLMKARFYVAQIEDAMLGTDPPNISTGQMESMTVPLIDENEQSRIGALLKQQRIIHEQYTEQCKKAIRLKTALMQDLLTGKVRVTPLLSELQEASA